MNRDQYLPVAQSYDDTFKQLLKNEFEKSLEHISTLHFLQISTVQ